MPLEQSALTAIHFGMRGIERFFILVHALVNSVNKGNFLSQRHLEYSTK